LFSERPINDGRIQFLFMLDLSEDSGSDRKPNFRRLGELLPPVEVVRRRSRQVYLN